MAFDFAAIAAQAQHCIDEGVRVGRYIDDFVRGDRPDGPHIFAALDEYATLKSATADHIAALLDAEARGL